MRDRAGMRDSATVRSPPAVRLLLAVCLGAGSVASAVAQPSQVGQWSAPSSWPIAASHAALLPDGRVLAWTDQTGVVPRIWDPANGTFTSATQIATNVVGSASALLPDGGIAILGGRDAVGAGIQDAHGYDPTTPSWYSLHYMSQGRNEPSALLLGDGQLLAISGESIAGQPADVPDICTPGGSWSALTLAALALPRTPWLFALTSGDVLVAGPDRSTRRLTVTNYGSWHAVDDMLAGNRDGGSSVLLPGPPDRILAIGGRNPATSSCELLDLGTTTTWSWATSMARARRHHNATLLADGSVLVSGGTLVDDDLDHAVYSAERYDPGAGTWTTLASMTVPRRRGSVALLLPDARVLCAGGGDGSPGSELHADAEIFQPPYLFLGSRPTITIAPANIYYGTSFTVDSPQAANVTKVWLVRGGSVTCSFDSDQRALSLSFTVATGRLTVTAPDSSDAAPPGTYMLFLVSGAGVPSVAKVARLMVYVPPPVPPQIDSTPPSWTRADVPFTYVPAASGTQPIAWSLPSAPAWLEVSPATGAVAGVPTQTGQFSVSLQATNAAGTDTQTWTLEVTRADGVRTWVALGDTWRYFKGSANPGTNWATPGYDDSGWSSGPSGFGFGDDDDATVLADMQDHYTTVFTRRTFDVYNVNTVSKVSVLYQYDDGLAVYLNGTRILAKNAPATITNTSVATASHEAGLDLIRQDFTDAATRDLLVDGTNVIAAVGLNVSLSSNDVTLKVQLELTGGTLTPVDAGPDGAATAHWLGVHPNPSRATARFGFALAKPGAARLEVYDAAGRLVRRIGVDRLGPGQHDLLWDGRDESGARVPPGVYLYRLRAPDLERRGKLTRLR